MIAFKDLLHLAQGLALVLVQGPDKRLVLDPAVIHDAVRPTEQKSSVRRVRKKVVVDRAEFEAGPRLKDR